MIMHVHVILAPATCASITELKAHLQGHEGTTDTPAAKPAHPIIGVARAKSKLSSRIQADYIGPAVARRMRRS